GTCVEAGQHEGSIAGVWRQIAEEAPSRKWRTVRSRECMRIEPHERLVFWRTDDFHQFVVGRERPCCSGRANSLRRASQARNEIQRRRRRVRRAGEGYGGAVG